MDVKNCIITVEKKWLSRLYSHCKHLFESTFLPSHDHLHHFRVWQYVKGILLGLEKAGYNITPDLAEQLILATFFHDTGLTVTHDERHGVESRRLCEDYLQKSGYLISGTSGYQNLFEAIEHHDVKAFQEGKGTGNGMVPGLLDILSGSDDLDALGAIGIYRYAEIYLLRGIRLQDLPGRVIDNVDARFQRLIYIYREIPDFPGIHLNRYHLIHDFYLNLDQGLLSGNLKGSWENKWIGLIATNLEKRMNLMDPAQSLPGTVPEIQSFLQQLHTEVSSFYPPPL